MVSHLRTIIKDKQIEKMKGVVLTSADLFGRVQGETFVKFVKDSKLPIEILDYIEYPFPVTDLSSEISKIKTLKPDVLFPLTKRTAPRLIVREIYKQRVKLMGIVSPGAPGWYEPGATKEMGKLVEYVMDNLPWVNPNGKMYNDVNARYSKLFPGKYIDTTSGYAYLAVLVIADALNRTKGTKPEEIMAALKQTKFEQDLMVGGPVAFNEKGDNINAGTAMIQILNGEPKVVLPKSMSQAEYIFPQPTQLWER
jgi:branched-chain amino acid transport system substrate-binding protein